MLDPKVKELLNKQINAEFYSAYLYMMIANYYKDEELNGFYNWYMVQTQEERDHAMLMVQFLQINGESVELEAIEKPVADLTDHMAPLKVALEHEEYVTSLINNIYAVAHEVKDFRTMQFLDWFIKEQVEEEDNANSLIKKMELFGTDGRGLYMLDQELGARVYSAPSLVI